MLELMSKVILTNYWINLILIGLSTDFLLLSKLIFKLVHIHFCNQISKLHQRYESSLNNHGILFRLWSIECFYSHLQVRYFLYVAFVITREPWLFVWCSKLAFLSLQNGSNLLTLSDGSLVFSSIGMALSLQVGCIASIGKSDLVMNSLNVLLHVIEQQKWSKQYWLAAIKLTFDGSN